MKFWTSCRKNMFSRLSWAIWTWADWLVTWLWLIGHMTFPCRTTEAHGLRDIELQLQGVSQHPEDLTDSASILLALDHTSPLPAGDQRGAKTNWNFMEQATNSSRWAENMATNSGVCFLAVMMDSSDCDEKSQKPHKLHLPELTWLPH